jgi:hypothetical protein
MAAKQFGGVVEVDHETTIRTLEHKRDEERKVLANMLTDLNALEDYETFNRAVQHLQSSIRALNILRGNCDLRGWDPNEAKVSEPQLTITSGGGDKKPMTPPKTGSVDIEKLREDGLALVKK